MVQRKIKLLIIILYASYCTKVGITCSEIGIYSRVCNTSVMVIALSFCLIFSFGTLSDKNMSDLFFVGQNFRHFCPTKNFVQSSFLLHITYISMSTKDLGKNLIWQNNSSDIIFVTFVRHFLSDKVVM